MTNNIIPFPRQRYLRPDRSRLPNVSRWNPLQRRFKRRMLRLGWAGRWRLLQDEILDFCLCRGWTLVATWVLTRHVRREFLRYGM